MQLAETILLALLTSTAVGGLLAFSIKHYLQRAIDMRFKPLEQQLQLEFEERKKLAAAVIDKRVGFYPEILEIAYRLRKLFEEGLKEHSAVMWDQDIPALVHRLYEILFSARAFLPDALFRALHEYKRLSQDIVQQLDVLTRQDNATNRELYLQQLPLLEARVRRVQDLYRTIQAGLTLQTESRQPERQ